MVVEVGGQKLTVGQMRAMVQQMAGRQLQQIPPQMQGQFMQQMMPRLEQQAIERFIATSVLALEAKAQKLEATEEQMTKALAELRKQIPAEIKWEDALEQMGLTDEALRGEIAQDLIIQSLVAMQSASLPEPTEEALKAEYEKDETRFAKAESASARHVLLKLEKDADAATKQAKLKEIKDLRTKILAGSDFAEIAGEHSECPSSAEGGSLGSFTRERMVPEFSEAAFSQELNKVGEVVETSFGYHLIEVTERNEAAAPSFEGAREQLVAELTQKARQGVMEEYLASLRSKVEITYGEGREPQPAE